MKWLSLVVLCWAVVGNSLSVQAQERLAPEKVILSVVSAEKTVEFHLSDLDALDQHTVTTKTPWTDQEQFSGPLVRDVLKKVFARDVSADDEPLTAYALNHYTVKLRRDLLAEYAVILATRMNGKTMRIRNKGPIWIVFPLDQHPQLDNTEVHSQMVWQLNKLESR